MFRLRKFALLSERPADSKAFLYMDTLEYLRKGGRIGGRSVGCRQLAQDQADYLVVNEEGSYDTVEKIRGAKAGMKIAAS